MKAEAPGLDKGGGDSTAFPRAKALPGGARVDPLTWKVDAEIVVALGESAAR